MAPPAADPTDLPIRPLRHRRLHRTPARVNGTSATIDSHSGARRVVENQDGYAAAPPPSRTGRNQAQGAAPENHRSGVRHLPHSRYPLTTCRIARVTNE